MLIFKNKFSDNYCVFIHIPKNGGKYIRQKIINNKNNKIIKSFWNINNNLDLAHIPFCKKNEFISQNTKYAFFTFSRNPYDRIISAFFYKNPNKNINDFKYFCKNQLVKYDFNLAFNKQYVHYYPQYLFLCDKNYNNISNIKVNKIELHHNPRHYNLLDYVDDECIEIINNIYKKDFELLNYDMILTLNTNLDNTN